MKQEEALTILKTGANVFLTGEAGSGKSHTVNRFTAYLRSHSIEPSITASTGIAATHIGGMTIHSWSGVGIKKYLNEFDLEVLSQKEHLVKRISDAKVLVIDEISMLDGQVLSMVELICRTIRRANEPFGGLQVVFVGDFFQLPPISRAGEEPSQFCFESAAWKRANPIVCYLSEQHRQEDTTFLSVLTAIRRGEMEEDLLAHLTSRRVDVYDEETDATKLYTHNLDVDRINLEELRKLHGKPHTFSMRHQGGSALVDGLKRGCLSPEELELKEGAKVLFTKNNFEAGYVNGTLGVIDSFDKDSGYPVVETRSGEKITAVPMDWTVEDGGKVLAKISQVPLRLAWAITVHKSQGMSMDEAVIDLSRAFEYGQGYVALSRVRTLAGLVLLGLNARALEVHPHVATHDEILRATSEEAARAFESMSAEELAKLHANFIRSMGGTLEAKTSKDPKTVAVERPTKVGNPAWQAKLEKLREKHPNAYRPWKKEDDEKLREEFSRSENMKDLSRAMGRQPGSIHARLVKLGLVEDDGMSVVE